MVLLKKLDKAQVEAEDKLGREKTDKRAAKGRGSRYEAKDAAQDAKNPKVGGE
jgi:hypothetical protein